MFKFAQAIAKQSSFFFTARTISWYPKYALPLLPDVAYIHNWMKTALRESESDLPKEYVLRFNKTLSDIRAIPWNALAESPTHPANPSYKQGKQLLEALLTYEANLPQPLADKLSKVANRDVKGVFDSVREGIQHLEFHRANPNFEELRYRSSR